MLMVLYGFKFFTVVESSLYLCLRKHIHYFDSDIGQKCSKLIKKSNFGKVMKWHILINLLVTSFVSIIT